MGVFDQLLEGHEQLVFGRDAETGLRAIVAVYSTARGPGLGGTRFKPYPSEDEAIADALRLSKAMAYKAACADLALGGAKGVIIGEPSELKTPTLLRAYARIVDSLGGAYLTCADVGTTADDLDVIGTVTRHVTGTHAGSGDPSPVTAFGVWHGMRAVAEEALGSASLHGLHVVISGVGKVGGALARLLAGDGARLTLSDIDVAAVKQLADELDADVCDPELAHAVPCDIFSPCALGGVISAASLPELACRAIAGAANNQLAEARLGDVLAKQGIVYAPDHVINAGGVINADDERYGYDADRAHRKAAGIAGTLREVFRIARHAKLSPAAAADQLAESRIAEARTARGW
jgi:leucine dehydrogenase